MLGEIETAMLVGAFVGLVLGFSVASPKRGCALLSILPLAMIGYIAWWQSAHPENLTSTSGLDFVFGPMWPSVGALVGFGLGRLVNPWRKSSP